MNTEEPASREGDVESQPFSSALRVMGLIAVALVILVFAQGAVDRLWFLHVVRMNSDEAVVALQGISILHGNFSVLFWGAHYGGTQPYVTAFLFSFLPRNTYTLRFSTVLISLIGTFFIWRISVKVLRDRVTAGAVTAISFAVPLATIYQLVYAYGFRVVTYACVFVMIYVAILIYEGRDTLWAFALLGIVGGIGWWSNPEILYGAAAVLVLVIPVLVNQSSWPARAKRVGWVIGGFFLGSLPWWWTTVRTHFSTLQYQGAQTTLRDRVSVFIHWVLPTELGLRRYGTGAPIVFATHHVAFLALYALGVVVLVACTLSALTASGARRAIGAATAVSPIIYVLSPANTYWQDGRYAIYFAPLFILTGAIGLERLAVWLKRGPIPLRVLLERSVVVVALVSVLFWSSAQLSTWGSMRSLVHWSDTADKTAQSTSDALVKAGFTTGWADYWTAYQLDFESREQLSFSPTPNDTARDTALVQQVLRASNAVWLISGPSNSTGTGPAPGATAPGALTYQELTQRFAALGVSWTLHQVGDLWVVVPSRIISPSEVGI